MKVRIDFDKCIGCSVCSSLAPEIFKLGDDDKAQLLDDANLTANEDKINDAAANCPQEAIILE